MSVRTKFTYPAKSSARLTILLLVLVFTGCSHNSETNSGHYASLAQSLRLNSDSHVTDKFLDVFDDWKGAPYRLGGNDRNGVDCSAFVQIAYRDAVRIDLPRTTLHQVKRGQEVSYSEASAGDLVFFKTSPKVRHVGVYLGDKQFMHASTSKGVIISRIDNPYWASKFWQFRRVASTHHYRISRTSQRQYQKDFLPRRYIHQGR